MLCFLSCHVVFYVCVVPDVFCVLCHVMACRMIAVNVMSLSCSTVFSYVFVVFYCV